MIEWKIVGNSDSLHSHAPNLIGYMKIYPRFSKSITMENQVLKKKVNIKTTEIIDLDNKVKYI